MKQEKNIRKTQQFFWGWGGLQKGWECDAGAFTIYIENSILIMENSDLEGYETLETPNIFLNPSILSVVTILI